MALVWKSHSCIAESEIPVWREGLRSITNVWCPIFKNLSHFRATIHVSKPISKRHIEEALGCAVSQIGDIASEYDNTRLKILLEPGWKNSVQQTAAIFLRLKSKYINIYSSKDFFVVLNNLALTVHMISSLEY